jgi:hypothetical protein
VSNHTFADAARNALETALSSEADAVVVASLTTNGSLVLLTRKPGPIELVVVARSLLQQALDETQDELGAEDGDSQGDDPREERVGFLLAALEELSGIEELRTGPYAND